MCFYDIWRVDNVIIFSFIALQYLDNRKIDKLVILFNEEKFMNNKELWTLGSEVL